MQETLVQSLSCEDPLKEEMLQFKFFEMVHDIRKIICVLEKWFDRSEIRQDG